MVNKKRKIVISGFILLIILGAATIVIIMLQSPKVKLSGTMYANDCGEPKGGFEWAAEYNVTVKGDTMKIQLFMGLGDYLEKHVYKVAVKEIVEKEYIVLSIQNGSDPTKWVTITLNFYEQDPIWGTYNEYYIAHYVDPTIFPGFASHFYVELRLRIIQK